MRPLGELPSRKQLRAAVHFFTAVDPLCAAEGYRAPEGFGITLSFNSSIFEPTVGGNGMIEIALKSARLEFIAGSKACGWSEEIETFAKQHSQAPKPEASTSPALVQASKLSIYSPPRERLDEAAAVVRATGHHVSLDNTDLRPASEVEIMFRGQGRYELRFLPIPRRDLVRFNPELNRITLFAATSGECFESSDVVVNLHLDSVQEEDAVLHCLRIRAAVGPWASLAEDRNRQIVSEILLSKFIKPIHKGMQLWPIPLAT